MTRIMLIAAIALVATAAQAQDSTTTCGYELGRYVCHTRADRRTTMADVLEAGRRGQEDGQRFMENYAAARAAAQERGRSNANAAFAQYEHFMATGNCESARLLALRELGRNEVDAVAEHCH